MDRLSSSIDSKIAQIRQAFSQPGPMTPGPQTMAPASAPAAVSQADVQWALELENKVKGGQQPSPQDVARYEDIARRLQAAQTGAQAPAAPAQAPAAPAAPPVPEADIQWALELENKVKGGQQPSPQDVARYEDIARRLQAAQAGAQAPAAPAQAPAAPPVPEADIQWAIELETKVNAGQQPSPQDVARYEDIARRLQAAQAGAQAPAAPAAANGPRDWANWSRPFAPPSVPNMPLPMAGPSGSPAIHVPTSLRGAPPTQPPAQAPAGVPTSLRAPAPTPQMAPAQAPQMPGGVSQQEIAWAMQLETRVNQQNYQPTPQEMAQYENIAQRLQAGQQPPAVQQPPATMAPMTAPVQQPPAQMTAPAPQMQQAPGGVSQQELDWALQLENRANNQGYTPTAQEMAQYENIAQRLQASRQGGAQPPGAYQPPVPQQPQFQQPTMPVVPQNYPMVQPGAAPQYLQAPQPFVPPQQAAAPGMPYPQQPGAPMPQQQSPGVMDRLKNAWSALWS
jgi:hypothetical protein